MRRLTVLLGCLLLLAVGVPAGAAEGAGTLQIDDAAVGDGTRVTVTVTAPRELIGTTLDDGAFAVTEGGEERPVTVTQLPSDDLQIVLAVDTSGSMQASMDAAKQAAVDFVEQLPAGVEVAVLGFGAQPQVAAGFTTDTAELREAVAGLDPRGETALYDAVGQAVSLFPDDTQARRTIVLLSDGGDTVSDGDLERATATLSDSGASLYAVELQSDESDPEALQTLVGVTDGRMVSAGNADALAGVYDDVLSVLVNQYALGFAAEGQGPTEITVALVAGDVQRAGTTTVALPVPPPPAPQPGTQIVAPPAAVVDATPAAAPFALLAGRVGLYLGILAIAAGLGVLLWMAFSPGRHRTMITGAAASRGRRQRGLAHLAERTTTFADQQLTARGWSGALNAALERAGINLRPGEFAVLVVCGMLAGAALGMLLGGIIVAVVLAALTGIGARLWLTVAGNRRTDAFGEQLSDTLQLLAGSLRAGYGLMQAIDSVSREADEPTADEFRRVLMEVRLGRDLGSALDAMAARVGSEDFQWVVQAINIHREVGGDLAEVLDTVAGTIREREQIRRQVKALSAEGRLSAIVLLALPFGLGFIIWLTNPTYLAELTQGGALGWGMIATGFVLMGIGAVWLKNITKLVF